MVKEYGREFCDTDESNPIQDNNLECIGNITEFLGKEYPCDDYYRYWIFQNKEDPEAKYYAFWDLGNGWSAGRYFIADGLVQLWSEITDGEECSA